jgi:hypothetical protein
MTELDALLVGFTGHQAITPRTHQLVSGAIREALKEEIKPIGLTSLATGSDQIFAHVVLELGGKILVVLPAKRYEESFQRRNDLANFRRLLGEAEDVITMPFERPSEEAYWAAGQEIAKRSHWLLAVWDGQPAGGLGGTADIVQYARAQGKRVTIIWPKGSHRN